MYFGQNARKNLVFSVFFYLLNNFAPVGSLSNLTSSPFCVSETTKPPFGWKAQLLGLRPSKNEHIHNPAVGRNRFDRAAALGVVHPRTKPANRSHPVKTQQIYAEPAHIAEHLAVLFYIPVSVGQTQFYRRHIELVALEPVHLYAELAETPDEGASLIISSFRKYCPTLDCGGLNVSSADFYAY